MPLDILAFHPSLDAVFVRILDGFYWYHSQSRKFDRIMSCSPWTTADMRFLSTATTHSQNGMHTKGFDGKNGVQNHNYVT